MIDKVAIIGFGSIGKKHLEIFKKNKLAKKIYIISSQDLKFNEKNIFATSIRKIKKVNPDYFVISSETSKHLKFIKFIENNFKNKCVLVEKPLSNDLPNFQIKKNSIYVGYNLRFHPVIQYVSNLIKNTKIISIDSICRSNLKNWRKIKYTESSSASKKKGGGVLLDLSHELDYIYYLFGDLFVKYSFNKKISNLNIDSDDTLYVFGKTLNNSLFSIIANYYSKIEFRSFTITGNNIFIYGDLINNYVLIKKNKKIVKKSWNKFNIMKTYLDQHISIIRNENSKILSNYNQSIKLMKIIRSIKLKK